MATLFFGLCCPTLWRRGTGASPSRWSSGPIPASQMDSTRLSIRPLINDPPLVVRKMSIKLDFLWDMSPRRQKINLFSLFCYKYFFTTCTLTIQKNGFNKKGFLRACGVFLHFVWKKKSIFFSGPFPLIGNL